MPVCGDDRRIGYPAELQPINAGLGHYPF